MRFPDEVPSLTDGVVTLRAHRPDDAEAVWEQCQDPLSQQWTTVPVPYSRNEAVEFIARVGDSWTDDQMWNFAIETDGGSGPGRFGGTIGLDPKGIGLAEIMYGAHPAVRGRGVMTRAVRLILDWAFEATAVRTVIWWAAAGNIGSWRVAWRNGFSFDGQSREVLTHRGVMLDGWMGTLRSTDSREPKTRWLVRPDIAGDRVRMRAPRVADAGRCLESTRDPVSWHWLATYGAGRPLADVERWIRDDPLRASLGRGFAWTLADPDTDVYCGQLNVFDVDGADHKTAELGYWLHPDGRGRGLLHEAVERATEVLFAGEDTGGTGLRRLRLNISDGNTASMRLAYATGFTECGRDRASSLLADGSVVDTLRYERLA
jgi:ribosomal-protein-alanine N-acetyltransferase